ncbi:MAG: hypothetical protein ACYCSG_00880 [Thermoplasmataceae archaeon]
MMRKAMLELDKLETRLRSKKCRLHSMEDVMEAAETAIGKAAGRWARRGEYMTNQCKFGMGNYLFIPSAGDTCVSVMRGMKLSYLQNHRPQREQTKHSIVMQNWEGRIRPEMFFA